MPYGSSYREAYRMIYRTLNNSKLMPKIERNKIEKVLETAKIEEVIKDCLGSYGPDNKAGLKKVGVRYEALCPFHDDKSLGSFVVYPKGNCYKCFSCGAKGGVVDFLMKHEGLSYPDAIRWLGKKYNIDVDGVDVNWTYTPRPAPPPLDLLTLPKPMVQKTMQGLAQDNLVKWIMNDIRWDYVQSLRVMPVLAEYCVGHGKNGHTIFWQIDEQKRVRTGKMMKYYPQGHPKFGHRDKEASWNFDFIHSTLSRKRDENDPWPFPQIYNPDKQEPQLTFFGMHLLDKYGKSATVNIVESEKTALLMAIAYGNHATQVWMACGGLEMITRERLKPIIDRGRRIVLLPDRDGIEKWKVKAEQMHYERMTIDTKPVTEWWKSEDGEKADIADVVIRIINNSTELKTIDQVRKEMPQANGLIDKLNLEVDNGEQ